MVPGAGRYVDGSGTVPTVVPPPDMIVRPEVRCRRHGPGPPALLNSASGLHAQRTRPCAIAPQAATMLSPSTLTWVSGSGLVAGPPCGEPSEMENVLLWHGQKITPASTLLTSQPACVQVLLNALYVPFSGW